MSLAHQLNVSNVRVEIPWFLVEPGLGSYDWTRADYIFNSATARGVQINPILVYTPAWDGAKDAFPVAADFGAFVGQFMNRYGGRISAVEMWNEPDGGQSLAVNDPTKYVNTILIPGYNAVKQSSHPNVKVIEGGSINDSGGTPTWLNGVYAAGGGNYFDIAAFHDYGGNYAQIAQLYQSVLSSKGQGNKPVWLGEFGVSDANGSQQTSLILAAMTNTAALAVAQFYTLRDESVYRCCPPTPTGEHKQYGVVAADGVTKKSSFYTMQSILGGSSPPPPPAATTPPTQPKPTPSPAAATPTPAPSPSPTPTPTEGQPTPGITTSGTSGPGGGSPLPLTVAALRKGGPRTLYFGVLLIGIAALVVGLALATNVGIPATARLAGARLRSSVQSRRHVGVVIAICGAILLLAAILLLNVLPRSG